VLYAADDGAMCKKHPDVGSAACYNCPGPRGG
jgi:hypothetical protein